MMKTPSKLQYSHEPLPNTTSIRLLKLCHNRPARRTSSSHKRFIQLSLEAVDPDDGPDFHALSYTWGSPCKYSTDQSYDSSNLIYPTSVNGKQLNVTRNLYEFLLQWKMDELPPSSDFASFKKAVKRDCRHLGAQNIPGLPTTGGKLTGIVYLWVDAICINQADAAERSAQVPLMSRIYSQATRVLVWFGVEDENARAMSEFLHMLEAKSYSDVINPRDESGGNCGVQDESIREMISRAADWRNTRSYFQRVWVMQEFVLGKELWLICGAMEFSYVLLVDSMASPAMIAQGDSGLTFAGNEGNELLYLIDIRMKTNRNTLDRRVFEELKARNGVTDSEPAWEKKPSLPTLMALSWTFKATDARDKVYALLGLAGHDARHRIVPDYSANSVDVIVQAGRIFMQGAPDDTTTRFECLEGLSFIRSDTCDVDPDLNLPSWIASFGSPISTGSRFWSQRFKAGIWDGANHANFILPSEDPRVLCLNGIPWDEIVEVLSGEDTDDDDWYFSESAIERIGNFIHPLANINRGERPRYTTSPEGDGIPDGFSDVWPEQFDRDFVSVTNLRARCLFRTTRGYLGLGPRNTRVGDQVWVIAGARTPFVLREPDGEGSGGRDGQRKLVGEAYVHGIMGGEVMIREGERLQQVSLL